MLGAGANRFKSNVLDENDIFNQSQELKFDSQTISQLAFVRTPPSNLVKKLEMQAIKADDDIAKNNKAKKQAAKLQPVADIDSPTSEDLDETKVDGEISKSGGHMIHKENVSAGHSNHNSSVGKSGLSDGLKKENPQPAKMWKMRVYLHCVDANGTNQDVQYLKMQVPMEMSVESVIIECIKQYNSEQRKPPLVENSSLFELRTCAEEEDDDEDEDSIVLDRKREIAKCGFKIVSLNKCQDVTDADIILLDKAGSEEYYPSMNIRKANSGNDKTGLFRIVMEGKTESHVVQFPKDQTVDKLLLAVAKKRKEVMQPEDYEFFKIEDGSSIDFYSIVGELNTENIGLRKKQEVKGGDVRVVPLSSGPQPSDFLFTKETASVYKEFEVIKHKSRTKKQLRVMGIDEDKIYNLPPENTVESSSLSLRILSLGPVKKKEREMSDVIIAEVIQGRMFRIMFRDLKTNAIVPYEYEAASEYECAEIVAKVEFLRKHL
eukprot:TRINITY_DN16220_c0_g1_i1.p1 TRINITY_DN16220_c0_g1~~TRINITY_DN16220_c0_g1_i1.p1  ORF type:complete len:490 (-),score=138.47 TRINITY_DN16220_c0_g1_i1:35-1504(-)